MSSRLAKPAPSHLPPPRNCKGSAPNQKPEKLLRLEVRDRWYPGTVLLISKPEITFPFGS